MKSLNASIKCYNEALKQGEIRVAYRGIMSVMSELKSYLEKAHPDFVTSALYFGYMDMTYFAFTSPELKAKKLKVAIVYLHVENRFEIWLSGTNRSVQSHYHQALEGKDLGAFKLSVIQPGVDAIVEYVLVEMPDFDDVERLKVCIEKTSLIFIDRMAEIIG